MTDYFALAVDQARQAFVPPPSAPPSICCAAYAYVLEQDGADSTLRCPVCNKSFVQRER